MRCSQMKTVDERLEAAGGYRTEWTKSFLAPFAKHPSDPLLQINLTMIESAQLTHAEPSTVKKL